MPFLDMSTTIGHTLMLVGGRWTLAFVDALGVYPLTFILHAIYFIGDQKRYKHQSSVTSRGTLESFGI